MALPSAGDVEYVGTNGPGGQVFGQTSSDLIGFYGATPVAKTNVACTAASAVGTTTISQVATSGKWAFASSTAAIALVTRVRQLQVDVEGLITQLDTLGLV